MQYTQSSLTLTIDKFTEISKLVPSHLKIDVDDAELMVVNGMKNLLRNQTLKRIFIEIYEKDKSSKKALKIILIPGLKFKKK